MAALESSNSDCYRIIEEYLQLHNEKLTNGSAEETTEREDKNKDDNNNNAISNKSSVNNNTPSDKNQLKNVSFEELAEADRPYIVRRRAIKTHKFPHSQQFVNLSL